MKKCKKCGYENPDNMTVCENCYSHLDDESSGETSEKFFKKLERKEKIKKVINYALLVAYFLIVTPLFLISSHMMGSLGIALLLFVFLLIIIPVMFYTSLFHPDTLFMFTYFHMISNIEETEPSDWFYISTAISAYAFLILGLFIIIKLYFELVWLTSGKVFISEKNYKNTDYHTYTDWGNCNTKKNWKNRWDNNKKILVCEG